MFKFREEDIRNLTLHFIDKERQGEAVDKKMLKHAVDVCITFPIFRKRFIPLL